MTLWLTTSPPWTPSFRCNKLKITSPQTTLSHFFLIQSSQKTVMWAEEPYIHFKDEEIEPFQESPRQGIDENRARTHIFSSLSCVLSFISPSDYNNLIVQIGLIIQVTSQNHLFRDYTCAPHQTTQNQTRQSKDTTIWLIKKKKQVEIGRYVSPPNVIKFNLTAV